MRTRSTRLRLIGAGGALAISGVVAVGVAGHLGASAAGGNVVVVHGTGFPNPSQAGLSLVGCDDLYQVAPETPQPMIGQGPGDAPIGDRSLAYDLAGGNALGAMYRVDSVVTTTTASIDVHPWVVASTGVAYVAYQAPDDDGTGQFWVGRAALSAPGGGWSNIDAAHRDYTWTHYDLATNTVSGQGPAQAESVSDFANQHGGDGPGVYTIGFGCDGTPFNIDALRINSGDESVTYDLEGLTTQVAMSHRADPSGGTVLRGVLTSGNGDPLPDSTLLLEQSGSASGPWHAVGAVPVHAGLASTTVDPDEDTFYRWRFVDRPLAAGSVSSAFAVTGSGAEPSQSPSDEPTASASAKPSASASASATPSSSPSSSPSDSPSQSASDQPTASPSQSATDTPSAKPSDQPSDKSSDKSSDGPTRVPSQEPSVSSSATASDSASPATASPSGS